MQVESVELAADNVGPVKPLARRIPQRGFSAQIAIIGQDAERSGHTFSCATRVWLAMLEFLHSKSVSVAVLARVNRPPMIWDLVMRSCTLTIESSNPKSGRR